MGLFSKTIPQCKWTEVCANLQTSMKSYRATWFKQFVDHVFPLCIGLRSRALTPQIEETIGVLQLLVATTRVRENGYVKLKAFDSFIDLMCISITSKKLDQLDSRSFMELAATPDPTIAAQKWASMLLPLSLPQIKSARTDGGVHQA
jgi:hypothetical protein